VIAFSVAGLVLIGPLATGYVLWPTLAGPVLIQVAFASAIGFVVLALMLIDLRRDRSPPAILLVLWVIGTLVFAGLVNWSVNGRSVVPLAPALGLVVARRLGARRRFAPGRLSRPAFAALAAACLLSAALALSAAWADYTLAGASRDAVRALTDEAARFGGGGQSRMWFQGHWGLQFYAERAGMRPVDFARPALAAGDLVLVPEFNAHTRALPGEMARRVADIALPAGGWVATMWPPLGAGFYSDFYGPLPFAVGRVPPQRFQLYRIDHVLPGGDR
jgi:hypothetical protein